MTCEDWKKAEQELSTVYGKTEFLVDGYAISVFWYPKKELQFVLMISVNGKVDFKSADEDCEIRRRFYSRHTKCMLDAKQRKRLKRERKAFQEAVRKQMTYEYFLPYWSSFKSMKAHFIKNNSSIELTDCMFVGGVTSDTNTNNIGGEI